MGGNNTSICGVELPPLVGIQGEIIALGFSLKPKFKQALSHLLSDK